MARQNRLNDGADQLCAAKSMGNPVTHKVYGGLMRWIRSLSYSRIVSWDDAACISQIVVTFIRDVSLVHD
jgi:hypothetical protein